MSRVSPCSRFRAKCAFSGKGLAFESIVLFVAAVLIAAGSVPLQAQSDSGLLESGSISDMGRDSEIVARGFAFTSKYQGKLKAEGLAAFGLGSDASTLSFSGFKSPLNVEEDCSEEKPVLDSFGSEPGTQSPVLDAAGDSAAGGDSPDTSKGPSALVSQRPERPDRNLDIYYRNRREFSLDVGWHPINIPFVYDVFLGDGYNMTPLRYTLVPIVASLRWHVTNVGWKSIFRGNMDFTFSGSITLIPRGPETHYYSFDFGIRRNFVYRNWKFVPFWENRGGVGGINAKEPLGVLWAQGQNLTFTYNMGAGVRYNVDSKYSFSAGVNYMHISNLYLSEPQFLNYGINVYGPMFGLDVRLGKAHHNGSQ